MNWIYRIKEQTVNDKTLFYPQRKKFLGFDDIIRYHDYRLRDEAICFDTMKEAKAWIDKEIDDNADDVITTKFHTL